MLSSNIQLKSPLFKGPLLIMKCCAPLFFVVLATTLAYGKDLTQPGNFFDLHYYKYEEPGLMSEVSRTPSLTLGFRDLNAIMNSQRFGKVSGTIELTIAGTKYTGTGTAQTSYLKSLVEIYAPIYNNIYAGFGYRRLTDYLSSAGPGGYDRLSNYYYLPIGFSSALTEGVIRSQFNYFLSGNQTSYLTQISGYGNDLYNTQKSGYGFDISFSPKSGAWETYWRYWSINKSSTDSIYQSNGSLYGVGWEPKNHTNELGVRWAF